MEPDLIVVNGRIATFNRDGDVVEAAAVKNGRIVAVGSTKEIRYHREKHTKLLNLKGKVAIPGFIDAHTHFISMGIRKKGFDLGKAKSLTKVLSQVKSWTRKTQKGRWIVGYQWDESKWSKRQYPTLSDLDAVAQHHPTALYRVDGHMAAVNTQALKVLKIPRKTRGFMVDEEGQPLGIVKEDALDYVSRRERDVESVRAGLLRAIEEAHKLGATSVHDMVNSPSKLTAYQQLKKKSRGVRVYACFERDLHRRILPSTLTTSFGDEFLRLGALKFYVDGSIGARTAALGEPYVDEKENRGMLVYDQDELIRRFLEGHRAGFQLAIHAIGDRGIEAALDALEYALKRQPRKEHRHRLEHAELATDEQMERMASMGVIASMQPNFTGEWGMRGGMYQERLGKMWKQANRFRLMLDAGVTVAFGSDCMPFSPLYGVHCAVNGPTDEHNISMDEALRCYTVNGAFASFEEGLKGSLAVGKVADMAVLSDDPWRPDVDVRGLKVELTILNGEVVYSAGDLKVEAA